MFNNFWTANPIWMLFGREHIYIIWTFRGSIVKWWLHHILSKETYAFCSSEPNRNDCWCLVPTPCPDWFKPSSIPPTGFGLLNHQLACFFENLTKRKVKVKCIVRPWKQNKTTHLHESALWQSTEKKHDRALWQNKPKTRIKQWYISDIEQEFMFVSRR